MKKILPFIRRYAFVCLAAGLAVLAAVSVSLHFFAVPDNVSSGLMDLSFDRNSFLGEDHPEESACVTEAYAFTAQTDALTVVLPADENVEHGIRRDDSLPTDEITVACFVVSDIADASLVRRLWPLGASYADGTLTFSGSVRVKAAESSELDIKHMAGMRLWKYSVFVRITAHPDAAVTVQLR